MTLKNIFEPAYLHSQVIFHLIQTCCGCESRYGIRWECGLASRHDAVGVSQISCWEDQSQIGEVPGFWHFNANGLCSPSEIFRFPLWFVSFMVVNNVFVNSDRDLLYRDLPCFVHPIWI